MKIIFMGSPEFAVPALRKLHSSNFDILAVYSQPPAPSGRGKNLTKMPVHQAAESLGLEVKTPRSLKGEQEFNELASYNPDAIIVAGYGMLLRKNVLDLPKYGCINIHPSILPRWRGASPVERSIEAGDTKTAVCIMKMDEGLDTGDILMQEFLDIQDTDTSSSLREKTSEIGANLLIKTLQKINALTPKKQSDNGVTYAKKITKAEGLIDWNLTAKEINNKIRAFDVWPNCWFKLNNENIKILKATCKNANNNFPPGTTIDDRLSIQTAEGILLPEILQKPGKKPTDLNSFLNGNKIPANRNLNQ